MKDRAFLVWLYLRLKNVYHENELVDFMWKLRSVIAATPADQQSISSVSDEEFRRILRKIKEEECD